MIFRTTIDSVIADITKKIEQLKSLAAEHGKTADDHTAKATDHATEAALNVQHSLRANAIASKLEALVS